MGYSLDGRLVLVTGAGRGLGGALATALAEAGARVVATDVDEEAVAAVATDLAERDLWCRARPLDVTDAAAVEQLAAAVEREYGAVEILVNNAGIAFGGAFLDVPLDRHLTTYRVNIEGLVTMTHTFLPQLVAADAGRLVNIASASGFIGLPWGTTYSSSKWSVVGFSEGLRVELAELGHRHVKVTAVCPGYIDTGLFSGVRPPHLTRVMTPQYVARRVIRAIRRGRRRLLLPALTRLGPINVALPAVIADPLGRLLGVNVSMRSWRGHEPGGESSGDPLDRRGEG